MPSIRTQRLLASGITIIKSDQVEPPSYIEYVRMRGRKFMKTSTLPSKSRKHGYRAGRG